MATELASNPGFGTLPSELVMNIIEWLPIENPRDIRNLSLTSRRMYQLSLDHMYKHILVTCPWPLTQKLLHDPKLAARVQKVTWDLKTADDDGNEKRRNLCRLMRFLQTAGATSMNRPRMFLTWRDHQFMAFFITVTPAIHTLIIKDTSEWENNIYWFRQAVVEVGALQHLRRVHIHGPLCLEQIAHLFLVPSLRDVTVIDLVQLERTPENYLEWKQDTTLRTLLEPGVSFVENITLKRACVEPLVLAYFTMACKNLKSFVYETDVHNDLRRMRPASLLSKFQGLSFVLTGNHASLEKLSVRGDHQMLYQKHIMQVARLASVMSNLRSLDMGLITHDDDPEQSVTDFVTQFICYLPPTLEELTFEMDWQEHWGAKGWEGPTEMLRCFAETAPMVLPLLKRVAVVDWPPKLCYFPPDFAMLYQCFAEHNVHFASIPADIPVPDPLRMSEFVEPGWVFVEDPDAEFWHN
ncbi:hypothetical protein yc1106_05128 [Curvularia clavata]|uniref:F-box domain-containing protein n=1 Tax=Curvularia clavata TaxID=95742 RepID=A0A9Q8ZAF9_CURCL|nr:hypothetical protein yc1106_05128 [Curvularia clavata]